MDAPLIDVPMDQEIGEVEIYGAAIVATFMAGQPPYYRGEPKPVALGDRLHETEQILRVCSICEYEWTILAVIQLQNNVQAWWQVWGHSPISMTWDEFYITPPSLTILSYTVKL
ncbi:hypothetical protein PanWU01x14_297990 [Parasponia andersonii]|uniref:Uncharacterized protein n=1 Tax=Parasponia andersonii TaxID=3476 RepID=A0A2P5AUY3_PARAD|nr:hypothetical protein PanWU01x14_297990 [Parasponia andersonii]